MSFLQNLDNLDNQDFRTSAIRNFIEGNLDQIKHIINADEDNADQILAQLLENGIVTFSSSVASDVPIHVLEFLSENLADKRLVNPKRHSLERQLLEAEAQGYVEEDTELDYLYSMAEDEYVQILTSKIKDIERKNREIEDNALENPDDWNLDKINTIDERKSRRVSKLREYLKHTYTFERNEQPIMIDDGVADTDRTSYLITVFSPAIYEVGTTHELRSDQTPLFNVFDQDGFGRYSRNWEKHLSGEVVELGFGNTDNQPSVQFTHDKPNLERYTGTFVIKPADLEYFERMF